MLHAIQILIVCSIFFVLTDGWAGKKAHICLIYSNNMA